jgi:hypothetical protein
MMNSIDELYPLLRFLRISRYNDWKLFSMEIAKVSSYESSFSLQQGSAACNNSFEERRLTGNDSLQNTQIKTRETRL